MIKVKLLNIRNWSFIMVYLNTSGAYDSIIVESFSDNS